MPPPVWENTFSVQTEPSGGLTGMWDNIQLSGSEDENGIAHSCVEGCISTSTNSLRVRSERRSSPAELPARTKDELRKEVRRSDALSTSTVVVEDVESSEAMGGGEGNTPKQGAGVEHTEYVSNA